MTTERTFTPWPKVARLNRDIVITEKIDGTNAAIVITEEGDVFAQSRTQLITPEQDNFGFARWVHENEDELAGGLGVGIHFGEWWGLGIQRGYGLKEKRFSLFNTARWRDVEEVTTPGGIVSLVPILYEGPFSEQAVKDAVQRLRDGGSLAAPGFDKPEGVVLFHTAARIMLKVTLEKDEKPKGSTE